MFQFGASAPSAARVVRPEMPRRMCRLAVRRHDKRLLQGRRGSEYNAGTNDRMPLELLSQSWGHDKIGATAYAKLDET